MRLNEFYTPEQDQLNKVEKDDTRKARLTLEQLGKLRRYRDLKQAEEKEYKEFARTMYAQPSQEAGPAL